MAKKPTKKELEAAAAANAAIEAASAKAAADMAAKKAPAAPQSAEPMLRVLAQYVKDASFENPNAPSSLRANLPAPGIDLNVEVKGAPLDDETAEVTLLVTATAKRGNEIAFICELEYAGLFAFSNIPVDQLQAIILIECPRILFPFARQILADLTQNGGFPPLMLDPIDFAQLYRQQGGGADRSGLN